MGRGRTYIEELNDEEQAILEREKKHGKSDAYRMRCQAILLSNRGYTTDEIADFLEVTRTSIYGWFGRWKTGGIEGLKTKKGQGRKATLRIDNSEHVEGVKKATKRVAEQGGNLLSEIAEELELEEELTPRMLSLFLQKLVIPTSDFVKGSNKR